MTMENFYYNVLNMGYHLTFNHFLPLQTYGLDSSVLGASTSTYGEVNSPITFQISKKRDVEKLSASDLKSNDNNRVPSSKLHNEGHFGLSEFDFVVTKEGEVIENPPFEKRLAKLKSRPQTNEIAIGFGIRIDRQPTQGNSEISVAKFVPATGACCDILKGWVFQFNKPKKSQPGLEDYFIMTEAPEFHVANRELQPAFLIYFPAGVPVIYPSEIVLRNVSDEEEENLVLYPGQKSSSPTKSPGKWVTIQRKDGPWLLIIRPTIPGVKSAKNDRPAFQLVVTFANEMEICSSAFEVYTKRDREEGIASLTEPSMWHLLDPEMNPSAVAKLEFAATMDITDQAHPEIVRRSSDLSARTVPDGSSAKKRRTCEDV